MDEPVAVGRELTMEREARKQAEILLEIKTLKFNKVNQRLQRLNSRLEQLVQEQAFKLQQLQNMLDTETNLRQEAERELERLAFFDVLTGLPNRTLFNDRLRVALSGARRYGFTVAVVNLDVDRLRDVNDSLGHAAGELLLVEISRRLSRGVRAADTIARLGGDAFVILLSQLEAPCAATPVVERLIDAIGEPVLLGDVTVHVGANAGISFFSDGVADGEALQKQASLALHEAKQRGYGEYCSFNQTMSDRCGDRLSLSTGIDTALRNGEFSLAFQPIVDVDTGRATGMEALIRWQRADGRWICPATFIPHAEALGLIYRIDCWVLERACREAARWNRGGEEELGVAVNLSAVSVQQPQLVQVVAEILRTTCLEPHLLTLEITETAVITDPEVARRVLADVVALGVGLSVDDFGTGYSSLSYLTQFPISGIKLDRLFINRIGRDKVSEQVIHSVLELAAKLGLRVVAEGVEEAGQQAFLAAVGCRFMQGYYLVKPLLTADVDAWLERQVGGAELVAVRN